MKTALAFTLVLSLASTVWSQPVALDDVVGPNNLIRDPVYGVTVTYPAAWQVLRLVRWGKNKQENTISFQPTWPHVSQPNLYYQPTSNFDCPAPGQEEAHFRYTAGTKAASRVGSGLSDYQNLESSFAFTKINGRPAFSYFASFTVNGKKSFEYFTRVLGEKMMVMFFTQGPVEELEAMRREVDQMSATVQVP